MERTPRGMMDLNGHAHLITGTAPAEAGPEFQVVQLKAGVQVFGVICSPNIWGVTTHWNPLAGKRGRSERCTKEKGGCEGCDSRLSQRWKGYVHYLDCSTKREAFLEITPAACKQLLDEAPAQGTLRGLRLKAKRGGGGDNSRLSIELGLWVGKASDLPAARDPEPILELLWAWGR
jgi:hypothetical protein